MKRKIKLLALQWLRGLGHRSTVAVVKHQSIKYIR